MTRGGLAATAAIALLTTGVAGARHQSAKPAPLSVILLLDVSASVDFRSLELPRDVSASIDGDLLGRLAPEDRFGAGVFGNTMKFSGFLPGDRKARATAIRALLKDRSVGLNGPSRIWDAVDAAVSVLETQAGRRAIVLLTDGCGSGNRLSLAGAIAHAKTSDVAVSIIGSGGWVVPATRAVDHTPRSALEKLASETGGVLVTDQVGDTFRPRQPGRFFEDILAKLRAERSSPGR